MQALKDLKLEPEQRKDEEHSSWLIAYRDATNAERIIGWELAASVEFRRFRSIAKQIAKFNQPPFTVIRDGMRDAQSTWRELLAFVKAEGTRDANVQRYKGLGEMNPEQLWETTMNAETRTLLRVTLQDLVECEEVFTTLMGEDVENRRDRKSVV